MNTTRMILFVLNNCTRPMLHLLEKICETDGLVIDKPRDLQTMNALVDRGLITTEFLGESRRSNCDAFSTATCSTVKTLVEHHKSFYRDKWMV